MFNKRSARCAQSSSSPFQGRQRAGVYAVFRAGAALLTLGAIVTATAHAQPAAPVVTRADLAAAYLRMDKAYSTHAMTDTVRASVNRVFDRSTLSFFGGKFAAAVAAIDSATATLTGGAVVDAAPVDRTINGKLPSVVRDAMLARIDKLDSTGALAQAIASARARAKLLVDQPSRERSAEFLSNPTQLARDLAREVAVLERKRDPYIGQSGDAWRVFRGANGALVPMRLVAPPAAATTTRPIPVVIVLHGAGGDENMFIDAYGQGLLASMAMDAGVIVVSPATTDFSASPANFDSLMVVLRSEYRIDPSRIYVLGHSMGAGAAARLAQQRPTAFAAVACLAGGGAVTIEAAPPVLFIAADLDPIIPARTVKLAATATPTGIYEVLYHEGHTLMVANGVRRALPWLLEHRR